MTRNSGIFFQYSEISHEDAVEDAAAIRSWQAARPVWQHQRDGSSFVAGEFVMHDFCPFGQAPEPRLGSQTQ
ncbi:hypothetical protein [Bradyrhizobium sp. CCBAU 53421]|uniref:hypothetical protein n=1 Tax=Bradyrhizobium sp. CCBAU 53421 TaxID=1325120 RepID=UPI00188AD498|nr:hypothetical protein [Bradyrhizobium sp. CCBAU 53421]